MSDAENLAHIYECLLQNDESIRFPAQNQLLEFRKNNLIKFIETNLEILKDAENFSPNAIKSSLLYTRLSFVKATKAKRSNDETKQYLFIPMELANGFLQILFNFLSNSEVSYLTAQLLGQISCYILSFEPENQILSLICQELPNKDIYVSICSVIIYIFTEIEVSAPLQSVVLSAITPLLSDDSLQSELKSNLILVLNSMILYLPNFISSSTEKQEFAQSMLSLTSIWSLKKSSYDFWHSAAKYFPSLFEFIPDICEMSFNDIQTILNDNSQDDSGEILTEILQFWSSLGDQEINKRGTLTSLLTSAAPALFPLFLTVYQNMSDPDSLDSADHDIHVAAGDSILSVTCAIPENSIPILLEFIEQAMANLDNTSSPILKETVLFSFSAVIDAYESDDDEENENNAQIMNIALQCVQLVSQCIAESSEPNPSIHVISQSLRLLLSIVQNYPEIYDYSEFIDFLTSCIQNVNNPFCEESKELLDEIVALPSFKGNITSIFEGLLSYDNVPSLTVAKKILKENNTSEFALHYLPQLIALAEMYLKNECYDTPSDAEATASDIQACNDLLPFVIQMIVILIDLLKKEATPFLRALSEMMQFAYDQYKHPEALLAICSIARITNQNVSNAANLVILQLNNSILSEDSSNEIELPSYEMRLTAINSITLYLSYCKIEDYFHEFMRILLRLLESQQEHSNVNIIDASLKIEVIEAIDSLHFHFPTLMKPFFDKLIPIFGAALESIPSIQEQEEEKTAVQMNYAILEGIKLLLMNEPEESTPTILQMAITAIQSAIDSPSINPQCVSEMVDLLKVMFKLVPDDTKTFITTNEDLKQLLGEAKEQSDESSEQGQELIRSIDSLLAMIA